MSAVISLHAFVRLLVAAPPQQQRPSAVCVTPAAAPSTQNSNASVLASPSHFPDMENSVTSSEPAIIATVAVASACVSSHGVGSRKMRPPMLACCARG